MNDVKKDASEPVNCNLEQGRRLLRWGMTLFLIGLFTGFIIPLMENPRMGLSSHLEALMNSMFLILLGLIWPKLRLGARLRFVAFWMAIFGTYTNWGTTFAAGIVGAGERMMPMASAGYQGSDFQELLIMIGLVSLALAMVTTSILVLFGLRGKHPQIEFD